MQLIKFSFKIYSTIVYKADHYLELSQEREMGVLKVAHTRTFFKASDPRARDTQTPFSFWNIQWCERDEGYVYPEPTGIQIIVLCI